MIVTKECDSKLTFQIIYFEISKRKKLESKQVDLGEKTS